MDVCQSSSLCIVYRTWRRALFLQTSSVESVFFFCSEVLIISGDFNFPMGDPLEADRRMFAELLQTFGLEQHAKFATHISGNLTS